jgi:hypothetical protein
MLQPIRYCYSYILCRQTKGSRPGRIRHDDRILEVLDEETSCIGSCKKAPCVAVEHEDYSSVGGDGFVRIFRSSLLHRVIDGNDANRIWFIPLPFGRAGISQFHHTFFGGTSILRLRRSRGNLELSFAWTEIMVNACSAALIELLWLRRYRGSRSENVVIWFTFIRYRNVPVHST